MSKKITQLQEGAAEEARRREEEIEAQRRFRNSGKGRVGEWGSQRPRSSSRSTKTPQEQMVKVLTSATFIRGVFGILKKVMK